MSICGPFRAKQRYGFTKFVIVVPSVAIKEGVYKGSMKPRRHFHGLYANTPFDYFLYDSASSGKSVTSPPARTFRSWWSR